MERRGKWGRRNNSKVSTTKGEETEVCILKIKEVKRIETRQNNAKWNKMMRSEANGRKQNEME